MKFWLVTVFLLAGGSSADGGQEPVKPPADDEVSAQVQALQRKLDDSSNSVLAR
jgi:hypothetical protein